MSSTRRYLQDQFRGLLKGMEKEKGGDVAEYPYFVMAHVVTVKKGSDGKWTLVSRGINHCDATPGNEWDARLYAEIVKVLREKVKAFERQHAENRGCGWDRLQAEDGDPGRVRCNL